MLVGTHIRKGIRRSGAQGRAARRARRAAEYAEWRRLNPTPFERFAEEKDIYLARLDGEMLPVTYPERRNERVQHRTIRPEDYAVALFAVARTGESGLTAVQLSLAFERAIGTKCRRAKASALLRFLRAKNIIELTGRYSKGLHGNRYRILQRWEQPGQLPPAMPLMICVPTGTIDDMTDPF